jgi:ubiquinone/menaquinone biosynthesis C-methylase UbiE
MYEDLHHFIKPGMTVIDFGAGPGKDLLIAAEIVGPDGKAIGVDMTDEMLEELKQNATKRSLKNVVAHKSDIENISLESVIADVIISNCVINLTIDKQKTFNEAFRLLKSGGILLDADVIAEQDLGKEIQENRELWCSCVGGALTEAKYKELLKNAGFVDIQVKYASKNEVQFDAKTYGIHSGLIYARKP